MCGINGFNWKDEKLIARMNKALTHRGPDDQGIFTNGGVSLGHTRLSILDLSEKGHQPMPNADQSIWIAYNGEIYNFKDLKNELEADGITFESETDTEVVLKMYQKSGPDCFKRFNGIFAFCIYDAEQDCLYLVRDRLGIKPVYYLHQQDKFIFSSELKAFSTQKDIEYRIDQKAVSQYFLTDSVDAESFWVDVKKLNAGHYLKFNLKNKEVSIHSYCSLLEKISQREHQLNHRKTEAQLIEELDKLLHTVIKDQMVSDAPLGTICSGGLDSSLVTAIACQYKPDLKIFNVRVDGAEYDESMFAHKAAKHLGLSLIEEELNQTTYQALYKKCIAMEDLPLTHPNSVGIYLISQKAKHEGISVLLSGEGADELFGGYHRYHALYKRLLINRWIPFLFSQLKGRSSCENAFFREFYDSLDFLKKTDERTLTAFILKDLKYYLVPILRRTDRMSMAAGLEMRVPYLDNRLIDFMINLPVKHKISWAQKKYLLKKIAEKYLPNDIIYRAKKGFPIPAAQWLGVKNIKEAMHEAWKVHS